MEREVGGGSGWKVFFKLKKKENNWNVKCQIILEMIPTLPIHYSTYDHEQDKPSPCL